MELKSLKQEMKDMKTSLMNEIKQEMTNRGFGSTEHNTGQIMELITVLTDKQTEALTLTDIVNRLTENEKTNLSTTSFEQAVATSAAEYQDFVMEEEELVEYELPDDATQEQAQLSQQNTIRKLNEIVAKRKYKVGLVKFKNKTSLSVLPPQFKFPTMTADMLIENWVIGNGVSANIPTFCTLDSKIVRHISSGANKLNKMTRFMRFVELTARKNGCWDDKLSINIAAVKALWAGIENDFKKQYGGKGKRKDELA